MQHARVYEAVVERTEALRNEAPTEPQTVVDATSRFQAQRYKWKPTPEDERALRDVVNRRVGWKIVP
ncbi:hypothetical protein D7W82_02690 [Corallococcus sp. CA049B]|nr:hypothetical protein D7W82_02690 [Corallococcus sp. CA049B]